MKKFLDKNINEVKLFQQYSSDNLEAVIGEKLIDNFKIDYLFSDYFDFNHFNSSICNDFIIYIKRQDIQNFEKDIEKINLKYNSLFTLGYSVDDIVNQIAQTFIFIEKINPKFLENFILIYEKELLNSEINKQPNIFNNKEIFKI